MSPTARPFGVDFYLPVDRATLPRHTVVMAFSAAEAKRQVLLAHPGATVTYLYLVGHEHERSTRDDD